MCFRLSIVSFSSFSQLCTCALDLEIILALHPEILLRVAGPAELIIVLADVEDLEDRDAPSGPVNMTGTSQSLSTLSQYFLHSE